MGEGNTSFYKRSTNAQRTPACKFWRVASAEWIQAITVGIKRSPNTLPFLLPCSNKVSDVFWLEHWVQFWYWSNKYHRACCKADKEAGEGWSAWDCVQLTSLSCSVWMVWFRFTLAVLISEIYAPCVNALKGIPNELGGGGVWICWPVGRLLFRHQQFIRGLCHPTRIKAPKVREFVNRQL